MQLDKVFNNQKIREKLSKFDLEEFNPEVYTKINLDSLLVYGIFTLENKGIEVSEENIYVQTYLLFPHRYSLPSFFFFPNAARLNKSWLRCRSDKNLITGTSSTGFKLTKLGLTEANNVEKILKKSNVDEESRTSDSIPGDRALIELFKKEKSFLEYKTSKNVVLSELEFCLLIKVRQTASNTLFETRFAELKTLFEEYKERDLLLFLTELKKKFSYFFIPREQKRSMMKPKNQ